MRFNAFLGVALAAVAASAATMPITESQQNDLGMGIRPAKRGKRGKGQNNRRGKGAVARAKKRSNRITIGKRVRRKHRRAA
jgi:hypothetical protein